MGWGKMLMERGSKAFWFLFGGCVRFRVSWSLEESVLGLWSRAEQLLRSVVARKEPRWSELTWVGEAESSPLSVSLTETR